MRQAQRLQRLEEHPQVRYEQELHRLRQQDSRSLEEIKAEFAEASETEQNTMLRALTDGQLLKLTHHYELNEEEKHLLELAWNNLSTLEEQARHNIEMQ